MCLNSNKAEDGSEKQEQEDGEEDQRQPGLRHRVDGLHAALLASGAPPVLHLDEDGGGEREAGSEPLNMAGSLPHPHVVLRDQVGDHQADGQTRVPSTGHNHVSRVT